MKPMKISASKLVEYYYQKDPIFGTEEKGSCCTWVGTGAERMGLKGAVDFEQLTNLAHGFDKDGTERLVGKENGPQAHHLNASTDILLTVPKSVSIVAFQDEALLKDIVATFTKTAEFAERFVKGRQTVDGVTEQVDGKGVGMLALHSTNRNGDPNIHAHLNWLNIVERPDGTYSTNENRELFRNQQIIQQFEYNAIAKVLTDHNIPIELKTNKLGLIIPEIAGVPQDLKDLFSSRKNEIEGATALKSALQERMPNLNESQIDNLIQLQTKAEKNTDITGEQLKAGWDEKAQSAGYNLKDIAEASKSGIQIEKLTAAEHISIAIQDLNKSESKFDMKSVMFNAMKQSVGQCDGEEIEKAMFDAIKSGEMVKHGDLYTTPEMIKMEHGIAEKVATQSNIFTPLMEKNDIDQAINKFEKDAGFRLSDGQASAVELVLSSTARLYVINGDAGSGKTTSMANIAEALKDHADLKIIGLSNDGKAAAGLQAETGIKSQTISSFLIQKDEEERTPGQRELWIVDEASKIGTVQLNALLVRAEERNAQLATLGDDKQLLSLSAGQMFTDIQRLEFTERASITEVKRQRLNEDGTNQYAINAAAQMRQHEPEKAIQTLQDAGRITEVADRTERLQLAANMYVNSKNTLQTACLVETNKDRIDLSEIVRAGQKTAGLLGQRDYTYTSEQPISMKAHETRYAWNYEAGNIATLQQNMKIAGITFKAGTKLEISDTDLQKQTISFDMANDNNNIKFNEADRAKLNELKLDGTILEINVQKHGDKLNLSELVQVSVAENEQIMLLKNDNTKQGIEDGIKNGVRPVIQSINFETGDAVLKMEDGKIIERNLNNLPSTNGQVISIDKSQGLTADTTIALIDNANENKAGVAMTRHRFDCDVITANKENMMEHITEAQVKTSTLDNYEKEPNLADTAAQLDSIIAGLKDTPTVQTADEIAEIKAATIETEKQEQKTELVDEQNHDKTEDHQTQNKEQETDRGRDNDGHEPEQEERSVKQEIELCL